MRRTLRSLIVAAGAVTVLAGCGGRQVVSDPPVTQTSLASVTPPAATPVMPALAKEHTAAGAKAFVAYFWGVVGFSQDTLDTSPLRALMNPTCSACEAGASAIDKIRANGGFSSGGQVDSSTVSSEREVAGTTRLMSLTVQISGRPQTITYPAPRGEERHAAYTSTDRFLLSEQPSGWRVEMIEAVK